MDRPGRDRRHHLPLGLQPHFHRHFVFSIPKILRRYFLYDRSLLSELSRCVWESLRMFLRETVPKRGAVPGAVIAIQTFGDFLGFHPHCHVLCTDGCFYGKRVFRVAPRFDPKDLGAIFEHRVLRMLLSRGKITRDLMALIRSWRHSGFQVYVGPRIQPGEEEATENLARYIIRASFSQERMTYLPEESKVIYESKDGKEEKVFDALDWLAAMTSHVPNKGEQTVRYYGHYSNASRGLRQKKNLDDLIPSILEPEDLKPNRTWARLIQKIYEVDPLTCPKCQGQIRILAFIEDEEVIEKILKHLGRWDLKVRPPPKVKAPSLTISIGDSELASMRALGRRGLKRKWTPS